MMHLKIGRKKYWHYEKSNVVHHSYQKTLTIKIKVLKDEKNECKWQDFYNFRCALFFPDETDLTHFHALQVALS